MAKKSRKKKKSTTPKLLILALIVAVGLLLAYFTFAPNTGSFTNGEYLYIPTGANYTSVVATLKEQGFIRDKRSFDILARNAGLPDKVYAGKYRISKGMSNFEIVKLLRSGRQTPVKLVIKKLRTKQDFLKLVSTNLEADSEVLRHILEDSVYLAQYGLDTNTAMCVVMPNTYEFYWNSDAEKVFKKIAKQYVSFWSEERKQKAKALGITPQEAIILASIVEEESNKNDEKPTIASVYLNRIKVGMKLQADPTARFAFGDFMIKRITGLQTSFESPYNTYKVYGLPPGPICTPSEKSILAVLNAAHTDYLYFCAKEDFSGYHNFAANLKEHAANARKYHDALNRRGIH